MEKIEIFLIYLTFDLANFDEDEQIFSSSIIHLIKFFSFPNGYGGLPRIPHRSFVPRSNTCAHLPSDWQLRRSQRCQGPAWITQVSELLNNMLAVFLIGALFSSLNSINNMSYSHSFSTPITPNNSVWYPGGSSLIRYGLQLLSWVRYARSRATGNKARRFQRGLRKTMYQASLGLTRDI